MDHLTILNREIRDLNSSFRAGKLLPQGFEKQLHAAGIDQSRSVLVEVFPDGCNTYVGVLITQNKVVFEFDIDLDDASSSIWVDITDGFMKKVENISSKKHRERIAYNLLLELLSSN